MKKLMLIGMLAVVLLALGILLVPEPQEAEAAPCCDECNVAFDLCLDGCDPEDLECVSDCIAAQGVCLQRCVQCGPGGGGGGGGECCYEPLFYCPAQCPSCVFC